MTGPGHGPGRETDASGAPDVAPPVVIQRRTASQRALLPRVEETVRDLLLAAESGEDGRRALLEARLGPLREALFLSPFWREKLLSAGLSPRDLRSLDDLRHFPFLTREELAAAGDDVLALAEGDEERPEARGLVRVVSSGTTGAPLGTWRDGFEAVKKVAALRFWLARLGVTLPPRPRSVLLCTLPGRIEYSVRLPLLFDGALHRVSALKEGALAKLRRARPDVLFSDPAGLHWLAGQDSPPVPRLLLTSAQYFSPAQRRALASAVPAPVVNYYSTAETGPIAWECPSALGRFHVLVPEVLVESVSGELVVTRLTRGVVPLLRYRPGDRGEVEAEPCPCGFRGPSITGFAGRRACRFTRGDGETVDAWRLEPVFKHLPLSAFRLTQDSPSAFLLEVARREGAEDTPLAGVVAEALRRLGFPDPEVRVAPFPAGEEPVKPEPFRAAGAARTGPSSPGTNGTT